VDARISWLLLLAVLGCGGPAEPASSSTPSPPVAARPEPTPESDAPAAAPPPPPVAAPASAAPEEPTHVLLEIAPSQGDLVPLLKIHYERAQQKGLKPYAEFYADWCPPCVALKRHASDPRLVDAFRGTYVVVLNLDDWQDKLKGTGFFPRIIPVFYELNDQGKSTGRQITGDDWGKNKNTPEHMAPVLKAFFHKQK
jgi:hypothetical protein